MRVNSEKDFTCRRILLLIILYIYILLFAIDGVDFRTFPHLIKCKSVSNQLRGLLEVEQLHFNCAATSESTRIDNMDTVSSSASTSNVNMDDLLIAPMVVETVEHMYSDKVRLVFYSIFLDRSYFFTLVDE